MADQLQNSFRNFSENETKTRVVHYSLNAVVEYFANKFAIGSII